MKTIYLLTSAVKKCRTNIWQEKKRSEEGQKNEFAGNPENESNDTSISNSNLPNKSNVITESKQKKISLVEARRAKYSKRNSKPDNNLNNKIPR